MSNSQEVLSNILYDESSPPFLWVRYPQDPGCFVDHQRLSNGVSLGLWMLKQRQWMGIVFFTHSTWVHSFENGVSGALSDENDSDHRFTDMPGMSGKYSPEDVRFMNLMSTRMFQRTDKYYEALAKKRLQSLKHQFHKDPGYHRQYSVSQNILDNGFAEVVPPDESPSDGRTWYTTHRGVIQCKLRVGFDCSTTWEVSVTYLRHSENASSVRSVTKW